MTGLSGWLARYADQPDTPATNALLVTGLPTVDTPESVLRIVQPIHPPDPDLKPLDIDVASNDLSRDPVLDRTVFDRVRRGNITSALRLISVTHGISAAYRAQLRAEIARVLFTRNDDAGALRVAQMALNKIAPADQPSLGFYVGGLAAWRLDRTDVARTLFEGGAKVPDAPARLQAASAFWASRASRAMHDAAGTVKWLRIAATQRLTFHGLLARRILRMNTAIQPTDELLGQADVDAVANTPQGWRAFTLLQIGQTSRAEAELRALWAETRDNPVFTRSVLMVTSAAGLANCAARMAASLRPDDGQSQTKVLFPIPRLRPTGSFIIDPALVYALTRIESDFDPSAISTVGAVGLMQIMPATARYIMGNMAYSPTRLHEPGYNLAVGQRYLAYLAGKDGIDNNLLRIIASYNCGPGNFARWGGNLNDRGDPLLFIEAIPIPETRAFVRRALLYSWIYAARMHLPASSLDALARDEFPQLKAPRFTPSLPERRMASLTPGLN